MVNGEIQGLEKELHLKNDFSDPSREDWRKEVDKVLKGAPYEKVLRTQTVEGITLEPIYTKEDVEGLAITENIPGYPPYVRSSEIYGKVKNGWEIAQELDICNVEEWNQVLLQDLMKGQTTVRFSLDELSRYSTKPTEENKENLGVHGLPIFLYDDLKKALKDIALDQVRLDISAYDSSLAILGMLKNLSEEREIDLNSITGSVSMDPIYSLVSNGSLCTSWSEMMDEMAEACRFVLKHAKGIKTISVDATIWNQSGSSAVEDLAFAFSTAVNYINEMLDRGLTIDEITPQFIFSFGIGSNMFMEIAKLRAARLIWSQIIEQYEGNAESQKIYIHAKTSQYNKTWYDPWVNVLRTTTESFSAIIGGCDSLNVTPFDCIIGQSDEFSRKIARNQQIILLEESHLNAVIDPAGGSWYIESLTQQLAEKAWELFRETENKGGMLEALKQGFPQSKVNSSQQYRYNNLATRKSIMIGSSMFANQNEKPIIKESTDKTELFNSLLKRFANRGQVNLTNGLFSGISEALKQGLDIVEINKSIRNGKLSDISIEALKETHLTKELESVRKTVEEYNKINSVPAKAFFASVGSFLQLKLRSDFVANFILPSGIIVENNQAFETAELAIEAVKASKALMAVIVATDDDYPQIVPIMAERMKAENPNIIVALAGYPKEQIEAYKNSGVDIFIHLKANLLETYQDIIKKAGILS